MKRLNSFFAVMILAAGGCLTQPTPVCAGPAVKVENNHLLEDFNHDGQYAPYFVRGVGYSPVPIGHFIGLEPTWYADCSYTGALPLVYPDLRFRHDSPEADYHCEQNGSNFYKNRSVFDRDFSLIKDMNANTIRTWGEVTPEFLERANAYGLKVIAGFWVSHNIDFTFPDSAGQAARQKIIDDFAYYVFRFKDDPAILSWGISNENNLHFCDVCSAAPGCDQNAQAVGFYSLINDMATAAKNIEGTSAHPSMIVAAEIGTNLTNYVSYIPAIDMIGINAYRGPTFDGWPVGTPNLFDEYKTKIFDKPLLITEFGTDAWNSGTDPDHPENGFVDGEGQSFYVVSAWREIADHSVEKGGPAVGGVVFHYSDQWNGYGEPDPDDACYVSSDWTPSVGVHDHNYTDPAVFGPGAAPDNKINPEWWGITEVLRNPKPGGMDVVIPRKAYHDLTAEFLNPEAPEISPLQDQTVAEGQTLSFTVNALDSGGESPVLSVDGLPSGGSFNPSTGMFQWTPTLGQRGTYFVMFKATDSDALSDTESIFMDVTPMTAPARITVPVPNGVIETASVTFVWSSNPQAAQYWITVGTIPDGTDFISKGTALNRSLTVNNIPLDGRPLYVTIWTRLMNGMWVKDDAQAYGRGNPLPVQLTSPASGSILTTPSVTFIWTQPVDVTEAWMAVGTTVDGTQLLNWAQVWPEGSKTVNNIPLKGGPVYFQMWSKASGKWVLLKQNYSTENQVGTVELTSPVPGSTLTTTPVTFTWTNRTDVTETWFAIGTASGGTQILNWTQVWPNLSKTVNNIPLTGKPIYVDMWYRAGGNWIELKATYQTEAPAPITLVSPAPGAIISHSTVTFQWTNRIDVSEAWLAVGTSPGGTQILNWTQVWPDLSKTVNNIPLTGSPVDFTMWYRASGKWVYLNSEYQTAAP